jgi:hypothetical protein
MCLSLLFKKKNCLKFIFCISGAQSSTGKIGNATAKSSSTSIFLESTNKVLAQLYLDIYIIYPLSSMDFVSL